MGLLDDAIREHLDLKRRHGADPTELERAEQEALGPVRRDPFEHAPDELEEAGAAESGAAYDQDGDGYEDEWDEPEAEAPEPDGNGEDATRVIKFSRPPESAGHEVDPGALEAEPAGDAAEPVDSDASAIPAPHAADTPPFAPGDPADPARYALEDPLSSPPPPPPPPHQPSSVGDETVEYNVEEAFEDEDDPFADDPLADEPAVHEPAVPDGEAPAEGQPAPDEDVLEETPEFLQDTPDHDRLWFEQRPPKDFDFDG